MFLLDNKNKKELGKIVTQLIIVENKKVFLFLFRQLGKYEQSDQELIIKITQIYGSKLALLNNPETPRTPLLPTNYLMVDDEGETLTQKVAELRAKLKMAENLLGKPLNDLEKTSKGKTILNCLNVQEKDLEALKEKS